MQSTILHYGQMDRPWERQQSFLVFHQGCRRKNQKTRRPADWPGGVGGVARIAYSQAEVGTSCVPGSNSACKAFFPNNGYVFARTDQYCRKMIPSRKPRTDQRFSRSHCSIIKCLVCASGIGRACAAGRLEFTASTAPAVTVNTHYKRPTS